MINKNMKKQNLNTFNNFDIENIDIKNSIQSNEEVQDTDIINNLESAWIEIKRENLEDDEIYSTENINLSKKIQDSEINNLTYKLINLEKDKEKVKSKTNIILKTTLSILFLLSISGCSVFMPYHENLACNLGAEQGVCGSLDQVYNYIEENRSY